MDAFLVSRAGAAERVSGVDSDAAGGLGGMHQAQLLRSEK